MVKRDNGNVGRAGLYLAPYRRFGNDSLICREEISTDQRPHCLIARNSSRLEAKIKSTPIVNT